MYALYEKTVINRQLNYKFQEKISIFGCKEGYIPWMLGFNIPKGHKGSYSWFIDVNKTLQLNNCNNNAIVIDVKPKNTKNQYITLCELSKIWGYSSNGWTPMMFGLSTLLIDKDVNDYKKHEFQIKSRSIETIYSFLYAQGSISNGKISGKWLAPKASPTNSALLWTESLSYFIKSMQEVSPNLFM